MLGNEAEFPIWIRRCNNRSFSIKAWILS